MKLRTAALGICILLGTGCHKRVTPVVTALPPAPLPTPEAPPPPVVLVLPVPESPTPAPPPPPPIPPPEPSPAALALEDADRAFTAANYTRAVARYEEYLRLTPSGHHRDKALFQLGVIHALPDYRQRSWDKAVSRLRQLVAESPQSSFRTAAQIILNLRNEVTELAADKEKQEQRLRQLTTELERLKQIDAERLRRP